MREYAHSIRNAIESFFEKDDWRYTFNEEDALFEAGVKLDCKLKSTRLKIRVGTSYYTVYATIALNADEDSRQQVAEYLTRANYGLRAGNFELDMRDGEVRYKIHVDCGDDCECLPSYSVVENSVYISVNMIEKYGDGLVAVMYGFKTAEEAVNEAEA